MHIEDYTQGNLRKQILNMAIPVSVGMFFNTMFNVVDTFYAGQLSTESLAGMSLSFSVFFMLLAVTMGISTGLSALLSIAVGKRNEAEIGHLTASGVFLTVFVSIVVTLIGYVFSPVLLSLLGATGQTLHEGTSYLRMIYFGAVFFALNGALNALLSSRGITKPYRNFLIIGFLMNLVLDPLFIFGPFGLPRLGTMGVALATVIVQFTGNVYLFYKCHKLLGFKINQVIPSFREPFSRIRLSTIKEILSQGIPASLNLITIALGIYVINYFIYRHGDDAAIAGYGVAMRIEQIVLLPAIGLNTAALTIAGQNFGAGNMARVKSTYHESLKIGFLIMTVGMLLVYPLADRLIGLFNDDSNVVFEGARYLRIEFIAFNAYIVLNIGLSVLQAIKKPQFAVWIGVSRQLVLPFILFTLLGDVLGLGLVGIWWSIVITVWLGAAACAVIVNHYTRRNGTFL